MRSERVFACVALGAFTVAAAGACSNILGLEPTQIIGADGATPDATKSDATKVDAAPPPFDTTCASALKMLIDQQNDISNITSDGTDVFWSTIEDSETGNVMGIVGGATVTVAAPTYMPRGLALDADNLYWNGWNTYISSPGKPALEAWSRSNHLTVELPLDSANASAGKIAIDSNHLYFGNWMTKDGGIWSVPLPLTVNAAPLELLSGVASPLHIAVDATHIYFDESPNADDTQTTVSVAAIDGAGLKRIDTKAEVTDLAVSNGTMYWSSDLDNEVNRNDGGPTAGIATIHNPQSIAIDATNQWMYIASVDNASGAAAIYRTHMGDTNNQTPQACVTNLSNVDAIFFANGELYFATKLADFDYALYDLTTKP